MEIQFWFTNLKLISKFDYFLTVMNFHLPLRTQRSIPKYAKTTKNNLELQNNWYEHFISKKLWRYNFGSQT